MPRVKKREHEKLTSSNIQHVINLLEGDKPITKKEACAILNISYNTTRLSKIIDDHKENIAYREERKNKNKGKAASDYEIKEAITMYLKGENVSNIAKSLYRSAGFVRAILDRIGVPTRVSPFYSSSFPITHFQGCIHLFEFTKARSYATSH